MSLTIQADSKAMVASKVQTKLKYTQTKLDLSTFSIKETVEAKPYNKQAVAKLCQDNKAEYKTNDDCKHMECEAIKEDVVSIDIYLSGLLARPQNAWSQDGGNMRVIANGINR